MNSRLRALMSMVEMPKTVLNLEEQHSVGRGLYCRMLPWVYLKWTDEEQ